MIGRFVLVVALPLLAGGTAIAHEGHMHLGKPTHGTVAAISSDQLTLQTDHGAVAVTLTDHTTVEEGDRVVGREALHLGAPISVFGTTLPGGEIVASAIHVEGSGATPSPVPPRKATAS